MLNILTFPSLVPPTTISSDWLEATIEHITLSLGIFFSRNRVSTCPAKDLEICQTWIFLSWSPHVIIFEPDLLITAPVISVLFAGRVY